MTPFLLLPLLAGVPPQDVSGVVTLDSGKAGRQAVVFLEGSTKSEPRKNSVIDQKDRTFIPHISIVTVGTRVAFPNHDVIFHNVFTEYHSQRFDLGMYKRGDTKYQVFDRPGLAVLLCSIHPDMSAYVMCVDTPYYALCDGKGKFQIPGVPNGSYTLRVWHESGEKYSAHVTVAPNQSFQIKTQKG